MIQLNQKFAVISDHEAPLKSSNTHLVAAACTAGATLSKDGYLDTIEQGLDGKPRRTVVWLMEDREITFSATQGETISTQEFIRRWNDREWCEANPDHPIVFMRYYQQTLTQLRDAIREQTPTIVVKKGSRAAYIPGKATEDEKAALLSKL